MRIQNATDSSVYARNQETAGAKQEKRGSAAETSSVDGSSLNLGQDAISRRRDQAKKEAMDVILDQFKADGKIDKDLSRRRELIAENKNKASEALKSMNEITERERQLKEDWGIADDSQEQQDLELRLKAQEAMRPDSKVELTDEEWKRYASLGPVTEYQQAVMDWEEEKGMFRKELEDANKQIVIQSSVIRETEKDLVKNQGMLEATGAAEQMMAAASKEIVGMAMQEAQEGIQEKIDEAVEKGKEQKEKNEEAEALREEKKAKDMELRQQLLNLPDSQQLQSEVEQRMQEILAKQKLLEEDLKGVMVDQNV